MSHLIRDLILFADAAAIVMAVGARRGYLRRTCGPGRKDGRGTLTREDRQAWRDLVDRYHAPSYVRKDDERWWPF